MQKNSLMDLSERAEAIRARNRILESVPGSGFHDNDRDAHNRLAAPHRRHEVGGMAEGSAPLPRISEHLVAFMGRRTATFAGADAERALEGLRGYVRGLDGMRHRDLTGTQQKLLDEVPPLEIEDGRLV